MARTHSLVIMLRKLWEGLYSQMMIFTIIFQLRVISFLVRRNLIQIRHCLSTNSGGEDLSRSCAFHFFLVPCYDPLPCSFPLGHEFNNVVTNGGLCLLNVFRIQRELLPSKKGEVWSEERILTRNVVREESAHAPGKSGGDMILVRKIIRGGRVVAHCSALGTFILFRRVCLDIRISSRGVE